MTLTLNKIGQIPSEIVAGGIDFFKTWIGRAGGLVAFVGAIKVALAIRSEDEKEIMTAALVMVSGFMIYEAVSTMTLFKPADSGNSFESITKFIQKWGMRVGGLGMLIGTIQFGLSIRDNNASGKVVALKGMVSGAMVAGITGLLSLFV